MRATLPAALLLLLASTSAPQAAPNIVVIMTDDQEDTGSMSYMPKTHALLVEKGLTFENSFVNLPLCAPSRASFLSGQSAHNTGIKANNPSLRRRLGRLQGQRKERPSRLAEEGGLQDGADRQIHQSLWAREHVRLSTLLARQLSQHRIHQSHDR